MTAETMEAMRTLHTMITQMMTQFMGMQNTQTAQAQTITELQQQWNAQHNELHRDLRTMQQATPSAAGRPRSLIDPKSLSPENFSGDKNSVTWRDWSFRMRSFVGAGYPKLRNLMERAEQKATPVTESEILAESVSLAEVEDLKVLLIIHTTGQAHTVLREDDSANGLEIYRRLARTYEPDSDFKNLADMSILIRPEPAKSLEDFARKFSQWKAAYAARLSRSGQAGAIAEDMRRSIWIAMLPPREREDVDRHRHLWKDTDALERHLLQLVSDRTARASSAAYQLEPEPVEWDDEAYYLDFEYDKKTSDSQLYRIETKTGRKKLVKTFREKGLAT